MHNILKSFLVIQRTPEDENNIESKIATLKGELQGYFFK